MVTTYIWEYSFYILISLLIPCLLSIYLTPTKYLDCEEAIRFKNSSNLTLEGEGTVGFEDEDVENNIV